MKRIKYLFIFVTLFIFASSVSGQVKNKKTPKVIEQFDVMCKNLLADYNMKIDRDSRTFDSCMTDMESRIKLYETLPETDVNNTRKAVLHAMAAWMYSELSNRFSDIRNADIDYRTLSDKHWRQVLCDTMSLAHQSSKDYPAIVSLGADGEVFNHDMLFVMAQLVYQNSQQFYGNNYKKFFESLRPVYSKLGNVRACEVIDDEIIYQNAIEHIYFDDKYKQLKYWQEYMKNYPRSHHFLDYKNKVESVKIPQLKLCGNHVPFIYPDADSYLPIEYWNCKDVKIEFRKYIGRKGGKEWGEIRTDGKLVKSYNRVLGNDATNKAREKDGLPVSGVDSLRVNLPAGEYAVIVNACGEQSVQKWQISTARVVLFDEPNGYRTVVLDSKSGQPVPNVKVELYAEKKLLKSYNTDSRGEVMLDTRNIKRSFMVKASLSEDDFASIEKYVYDRQDNENEKQEEYFYQFFTDRSIYRPGQKVQVGGVVYSYDKERKYHVASGKTFAVHFSYESDSKGQDVDVTTNEFGSFDCVFDIPKDAKLGNWRIYNKNKYNGAVIKVEEYKRPTWDVTLKASDSNVKSPVFGDTIMVDGQATMFSGVPVGGGKVEYKIQYAQSSLYDFYSWNSFIYNLRFRSYYQNMSKGETSVDDKGHFCIALPLSKDKDNDASSMMAGFRIVAKVTDDAGETHEATYHVTVSDQEYTLSVNVEGILDLNRKDSLAIEAVDGLDKRLDVTGEYIVKLCDKEVATGLFRTNAKITLAELLKQHESSVAMGTYNLELLSKDRNGKEIKANVKFSVFDSNEKSLKSRECSFEDDFIYCPVDKFDESLKAKVYYAPKEMDAYVYGMTSCGKKYTRTAGMNKRGMQVLTIEYDKTQKGGVDVKQLYLKNGRNHISEIRIEAPELRKSLSLSWSTYRDRLQPGQNETWTLSVLRPDGTKSNATELLATMYDASLDMYAPHSFSFNLAAKGWHIMSYEMVCSDVDNYGTYMAGRISPNRRKELKFDTFSLFNRLMGRVPGFGGNILYSKAYVMEESAMVGVNTGLDVKSVKSRKLQKDIAYVADEEVHNDEYVDSQEGGVHDSFPMPKLRSNFAETAFFYPHIVTNDKGEANIIFTLPESLTKWKFLGFAHDKEMNNGMISAVAVAQKQFMVQPQMPRFVRVGDEVTIPVRVINQGTQSMNTKVRMRLLDAETEAVLVDMNKSISVGAGITEICSFAFKVKENRDIICEVVGEGNTFTDGERNLLPVLPSRMEVVENVPFFIENVGKKNIDLSSLFNGNSPTASDKMLKVEYTDNPVWMVVDALKTIEIPESECATTLASSVYACSRLKDIESMYKEMPLALSDSSMNAESSIYTPRPALMEKLRSLQCGDGSFRWFPGSLKGRYYVTLMVAEQLCRMEDRPEMLDKAMEYLDSVQVDSYERWLAWRKPKAKWSVSETDMHYMFVCSMLPDRKVSAKTAKLHKLYLDLMEKEYKNMSIYGVASSACIFRAFGRTGIADKFCDVVRYYAVKDEGQGRHFETKKAEYSWRDYRIPTQVRAMQALHAANANDPYLNEMQIWLLRQKQVQKWDSPVNTVDVADLLFHISPKVTFHKEEHAVIMADGTEVKTVVSNHVQSGKVDAGASSISVDKVTEGISWGAATATFTEDAKHLKAYSTGEVKIERRIMVEEDVVKNGETRESSWRDLRRGEKLRVGQKVRVRHTLSADRDMDFVKVSSLHPACFEPVDKLSGYQRKGGEWCYVTIHDASVDMFFESFHEGKSTMDMDYFVTRTGVYNMGVTSAECVYAPMFGGHSEGMIVVVE